MSKIKTRETVRKIKTTDKPSFAGQQMKSAFIRSRERENEERRRSPDKYAENEVERGVESVASVAVVQGK